MLTLELSLETKTNYLYPLLAGKQVLRTCVIGEIKKRESMPFAVPMVWREGEDHVTGCYFCMTNLQEINRKNKYCVQYPDVPSAIRPVSHGPDLPVPEPDVAMKSSSESESDNTSGRGEGEEYMP